MNTTNNTDYIVTVYTIYSILSVLIIGWLAATLFSNGKHFLEVVFRDNLALAKAVNRLLVTGFIMLSLGYASLTVAGGSAKGASEAFTTSTQKFGMLLLVLGVAHLLNMLILNNMRKTAERKYQLETIKSPQDAYEATLQKYNEVLAKQAGGSNPPGNLA